MRNRILGGLGLSSLLLLTMLSVLSTLTAARRAEAACTCTGVSLCGSTSCTIADSNGAYDFTFCVTPSTSGSGTITVTPSTSACCTTGVKDTQYAPDSRTITCGNSASFTAQGELTASGGTHHVTITIPGCSTYTQCTVKIPGQSCP